VRWEARRTTGTRECSCSRDHRQIHALNFFSCGPAHHPSRLRSTPGCRDGPDAASSA
jgi:hypothetical protein